VDLLLSQTHGDVLVVYLTDTNLVAAPRIEAVGGALDDAMNRCAHGKMLVNFQAVRAMASKMLGKLVKLQKECAAARIDLKLCNVADNILEVFKVTRLNRVFDIHPDESAALKAFGKSGWFTRR
jgi:anti-sigma B factor antagonist